MKFIRDYINLKILWFVMALHILNVSVDPPDLLPYYVPEDLTYNEMESIVEIVLEQIFGLENAVPEHEDDDTNQGLLTKTISALPIVYFNENQRIIIDILINCLKLSKSFFYHSKFGEPFHPEIIPPPPKV